MTTAMITSVDDNLEIRCPERGRKRFCTCDSTSNHSLFGNKMPREGTETILPQSHLYFQITLFGNKMPREGTETITAIT